MVEHRWQPNNRFNRILCVMANCLQSFCATAAYLCYYQHRSIAKTLFVFICFSFVCWLQTLRLNCLGPRKKTNMRQKMRKKMNNEYRKGHALGRKRVQCEEREKYKKRQKSVWQQSETREREFSLVLQCSLKIVKLCTCCATFFVNWTGAREPIEAVNFWYKKRRNQTTMMPAKGKSSMLTVYCLAASMELW